MKKQHMTIIDHGRSRQYHGYGKKFIDHDAGKGQCDGHGNAGGT